jgi:hypothetical protein
MEHQVSKDVLDAFAYGFFGMCLVLSVHVAFRIRLRTRELTIAERMSAHRWCIGTAAVVGAYFTSLGIVTKELPTLLAGFFIPVLIAMFDLNALNTLRTLADMDEHSSQMLERMARNPRE